MFHLLLIPALLAFPCGGKPAEVKATFLRPAAKAFAKECEFKITSGADGWSIESVTTRGETQLTVRASYDKDHALREASAELKQKDVTTTARVTVKDKRALVRRHDGTEQDLPLGKGVVVTSAPDWSDIFLLCRQYDRKAGGRQLFPALWIHPAQPAQAANFAIQRLGTQAVTRNGKTVQLERFRVEIRGGSAYVAWADAQGELIKLAPLPFKEGTGIIRSGWEMVSEKLTP
jgi:hypothetical protein